MERIIKAATKIEPNELRATILSFLFVFTLMAAYFILRPVRDALSSDWTDAELSWLWTSTFFFSLVAVSVYGAVISKVRFRHLVPGVYAFFSLSFFAFFFGSSFVDNPVYVDKAFYVWLSVFSLFHVSVFWSFMSDLFSKDQAPRLFGIIATGASTGAIAGPAIPTFFADNLGTTNLMLIAAALLLIPIVIIAKLEKLRVTELGNEDVHADLTAQQALGRHPLAGFKLFLRDPFLLSIGLFILCYVAISTFVYFEIKNLLVDVDRDVRTQIWGGIDLAVNSLAILTAVFATGRLVTRFGMSVTLALVPLLIVLGLLVVAVLPIIAVVAGLQIARRAGNYAITRPGREMLFTIVDRETRFKAKPVIDIVVYRGGDMVTAWGFTALTAGLGLGLGAVAAVGAVIAAVWAVVGVYLGRSYHRTAALVPAAE
ncbi:MAG: NTP/NDP exchange transporter [Woeseiaceae bacterium]